MDKEHKISVARAVLSACADEGYGVAGSLALHLHQVDGAREPDDIDLFTNQVINGEAVRGRITEALRQSGYTVEQLVAWNTYPDGAGEQNRKLSVSHPEHGTVVIDMIRAPRYLPLADRDGIPTLAVPELMYRKIETLETRVAAKDYIDLAALHERLGDRADRYLAKYVDGVATKIRNVPPERFAGELADRLVRNREIPDEAFAAHGVDAEQAGRIRASVDGLAARFAPDAGAQRPSAREQALADEAQRQMAALTDEQLTTWRAQTAQSLAQAQAMAQNATNDQEMARAREFLAANNAQLQRIDAETGRRGRAAERQPEAGASASGGAAPGSETAAPASGTAVSASAAAAAAPAAAAPRNGAEAPGTTAPANGGGPARQQTSALPPEMADWLSRYREVVLSRIVPGQDGKPDPAEAARLMAEADAMIGAAFPDPQHGVRVAHGSTQSLLRLLAADPEAAARGPLPPALLTDQALAKQHASTLWAAPTAPPQQATTAAAAAARSPLTRARQQGEEVRTEMERRRHLAPEQREAEQALRQDLQARRAPLTPSTPQGRAPGPSRTQAQPHQRPPTPQVAAPQSQGLGH